MGREKVGEVRGAKEGKGRGLGGKRVKVGKGKGLRGKRWGRGGGSGQRGSERREAGKGEEWGWNCERRRATTKEMIRGGRGTR